MRTLPLLAVLGCAQQADVDLALTPPDLHALADEALAPPTPGTSFSVFALEAVDLFGSGMIGNFTYGVGTLPVRASNLRCAWTMTVLDVGTVPLSTVCPQCDFGYVVGFQTPVDLLLQQFGRVSACPPPAFPPLEVLVSQADQAVYTLDAAGNLRRIGDLNPGTLPFAVSVGPVVTVR